MKPSLNILSCCSLCFKAVVDVEHLFLRSKHSRALWSVIGSAFGVSLSFQGLVVDFIALCMSFNFSS